MNGGFTLTSIKDVAKYCGVSAMTVSRALNNSSEIADATKERVLEACRELGYRQNSAAKTLITKKSNMIGLIVPDITNQYYASITKEVTTYFESQGYRLILCNSDGKKENEISYLNFLCEGRVDGIILLSVASKPKKEDYQQFINYLPIVMVDNYAEGLDASFVSSDNYYGATKAMEHMIKMGYKKIGGIFGDEKSMTSNDKMRGFRDVIENNGMVYDPELIVHTQAHATFEDGVSAATKLIEKGVDGIFAVSDIVAMGAMKASFIKNKKVSSNIGICGYDNIEYGSMLPCPLTTVDKDTKKIAETSAKLLIEELNTKTNIDHQTVVLKPKLIVRNSCGEVLE